MPEIKDSIPTPGTGTPPWVTITEIISVTLLLIALMISLVYLLKLTFVYVIIPIVAIVVKSWMEIDKKLKIQPKSGKAKENN